MELRDWKLNRQHLNYDEIIAPYSKPPPAFVIEEESEITTAFTQVLSRKVSMIS